jgi:capsid portal protein
MDRNGVIRNFDEISAKYKKAAEEGNEKAAKQYEAIMKFMETNNLLQEQMDTLIDMQWQLMDARIERITTKVDIKVAVDDTDLQYLSYQLGKINEEAYDVAKALNIVGDSIEVNLNKINAYRQGLGETLQEAFTEIGLTEE